MIRFRFSAFEKNVKDKDLEIIDGELLSSAMDRVLDGIPLGQFKKEEVFQVSVNGKNIEFDFWPVTKIVTGNDVIVCPVISSGGNGGLLRSVLTIGVIIAATALLGPGSLALGITGLGLEGAWLAGAVAAVSIATSLLMNGLIPPPDLGVPGGSTQVDKSQMYSISGQSNTVKKLGIVPKVYGSHRIFPNVAANPYTELEVDNETGELVQFLYVIYDLGFGPMSVDFIKIGDTPLSNFKGVSYALVDFNRPVADEGTWDHPLLSALQYYKGDQEIEAISSGLDDDAQDGGPQSGYLAIRNASENIDGVDQTLTLSFVNQSGLYTYSPGGALGWRAIVLTVEFALVGTENWHGFNDFNFVKNFESRGSDKDTFQILRNAYPPNPDGIAPYAVIEISGTNPEEYNPYYNQDVPAFYQYSGAVFTYRTVGIAKGLNYVIAKKIVDPFTIIGSFITYQGRQVTGHCYAYEVYGDGTYYKYYFDSAFSESIPLFKYGGWPSQSVWTEGGPSVLPEYFVGIDVSVEDKIQFNAFSPGKARIQRDETSACYSTFRFTPRVAGDYKVRVRREYTTGEYAVDKSPESQSRFSDKLTWVGITSRFDRSPIVTDKRHVFLEMKILATGQLNGAVQNLSVLCTSVLDVWNGSAWVKQATQNPAWAVVDLLTGQVNKRAIEKTRLHLPSIVEWANFCDAIPDSPTGREFNWPRFQSNFVLDYDTTLQGVINQITSAAQASLNIIEGKYGVLIDRLRDTPIQIFTPRNSRDFGSSRSYIVRPHALSIKFIDPNANWQIAEALVYDNGYDISNATDIQELSSFACTNIEQAWRFGRYMMAQNALRQETMSITVDFEYLVCTRGDFVQITQDSMRAGGFPARVKSVVGTIVEVDDAFELAAGSYGYVFRAADGQIKTDTLTVVDAQSFDLDGDLPEVGDLIVVGIVDSIVFDCIVKSISPNDDLSATIILIEKADGVYDYESTTDFATYDPQISPTSDPNVTPPDEVVDLVIADNAWKCNGGAYQYYVDLDWGPPAGSAFETFQIFVDNGSGFTQIDSTRKSLYRYIVDEDDLGKEHEFKVVAVSATGKKLDLVSLTGVTATPVSKTTAPSDIDVLHIDITGEVLQLVWVPIIDCDLQEYLIRYSPDVESASWESSVPLLRVSKASNLAATQARSGSYLIKAIDFNGNESENAIEAITTIPTLFNLNLIEEIVDSPTWEGSFDGTIKTASSITIKPTIINGEEYYSEGYYYYKNLLDLMDIYTVRLQSLVQGEGFTYSDLMSHWVTLDSVAKLTSARFADWDVETQYRSTNNLNVIADWVSLSSVSSMVSGTDGNFTEWRKFIMGDATGRIFQFRLHLISNKSTVSPRIFDSKIRADIPDRVQSYNNLTATIADGYELDYAPAFAGPGTSPNVQISMESASAGDYWRFDSKSLEGFTIRFYNSSNNPVERVFDVMVRGYGRRAVSVI